MNEENRTHLLKPCAATALLNELSLNNSWARNSAANDEAVGKLIHTSEYAGRGRWYCQFRTRGLSDP